MTRLGTLSRGLFAAESGLAAGVFVALLALGLGGFQSTAGLTAGLLQVAVLVVALAAKGTCVVLVRIVARGSLPEPRWVGIPAALLVCAGTAALVGILTAFPLPVVPEPWFDGRLRAALGIVPWLPTVHLALAYRYARFKAGTQS